MGVKSLVRCFIISVWPSCTTSDVQVYYPAMRLIAEYYWPMLKCRSCLMKASHSTELFPFYAKLNNSKYDFFTLDNPIAVRSCIGFHDYVAECYLVFQLREWITQHNTSRQEIYLLRLSHIRIIHITQKIWTTEKQPLLLIRYQECASCLMSFLT